MRYQQAAIDLDVEIYFEEIASHKHLKTRNELIGVKNAVVALCKSYADSLKKLTPPKEQTWTTGASDALKSCYSVSTKSLSTHKDAILNSLKMQSEINVQRCAYCMLNDPRTWDHYMPKDNFPEYSIYHENLVYICYGCNQRKSNHFDDVSLIYCHPYFTVDSNEPLLHCNISVRAGRLSIQYYGAGGDGFVQAGTISHHHLSRLGLIDRFKAEASSTVSGLIGELRHHFPNGVTKGALDNVLQRRYDDARKKLGCNAWDSRLWHGLAACPDFVEYANHRISQSSSPSSEGFRQVSPAMPA